MRVGAKEPKKENSPFETKLAAMNLDYLDI